MAVTADDIRLLWIESFALAAFGMPLRDPDDIDSEDDDEDKDEDDDEEPPVVREPDNED